MFIFLLATEPEARRAKREFIPVLKMKYFETLLLNGQVSQDDEDHMSDDLLDDSEDDEIDPNDLRFEQMLWQWQL